MLALHGPIAQGPVRGHRASTTWCITTYPLLARDHAVLTAQDWHVVVLDEAQTIKNPDAEDHAAGAARCKARQRLCLSGTPLENHLGELWSLFDFLAPGFLGEPARRSSAASARRSRSTATRSAHALLARRVRPFLLRRTKEEVATELPPKTEIVEPRRAGAGAARDLRERSALAMHARVRAAIAERGLARSGIIILDALLKLRQACCDPRLLKLTAVRTGEGRVRRSWSG